MNEIMQKRLEFYFSIILAGLGAAGVIVYVRLHDYSNPFFYLSCFVLPLGVNFSIRTGIKFFRYLRTSNTDICKHNETWTHENGKKICSNCGNEVGNN